MAFKRNLWHRLRHHIERRLLRPRLGDLFHRSNQSSRRKYHRHDLSVHELAFVILGDRLFPVLSLSYGGLRIKTAMNKGDYAGFLSLRQIHSVTLIIMDCKYQLSVRVASLLNGTVSLSFERNNKLDEMFLSRFLYYMDVGLLLKSLAKHSVSNFYQNPSWQSYGGLKGAFEVHLHLDSQNEVEEAHIFYLNGMRQEVAIFTSRGIIVSCLPQFALSSRERRDILMHVLCILLGLRQISRTHRLDQFIQSGLLKLLKTSQKAS